nr:hypothetical protein [Tanacetum cinerariifolium]
LEAPPQRYSRSLLMKCANGITRRPRLPPDDIQALSGYYTTPLLIHMLVQPEVKEYQEKDKIGSKPDKNEKRGEAGKSQKQLQ